MRRHVLGSVISMLIAQEWEGWQWWWFHQGMILMDCGCCKIIKTWREAERKHLFSSTSSSHQRTHKTKSSLQIPLSIMFDFTDSLPETFIGYTYNGGKGMTAVAAVRAMNITAASLNCLQLRVWLTKDLRGMHILHWTLCCRSVLSTACKPCTPRCSVISFQLWHF